MNIEKKEMIENIITTVILKISKRIATVFYSYVPTNFREESILFIEEKVHEMYYSILFEDLKKDFESDPDIKIFYLLQKHSDSNKNNNLLEKKFIKEKYLRFYEARFSFYLFDWKKLVKGDIFCIGPRMFKKKKTK
jgi:hypothetical protein